MDVGSRFADAYFARTVAAHRAVRSLLLFSLGAVVACSTSSTDADEAGPAGSEDVAFAEASPPYDTVATGTIPPAEGFRGIWYANQPSGDRFRYKYSGGLGTFPQQHRPIAVYAPEVERTFFVFGGRPATENRLLHVVSFYDHARDVVARPRVLLDKKTDDAHDNPTLQIDDEGYLWIFSNAHGTARPAYIHRSERPYSIDAFQLVRTTNFSYAQPWHLEEHGFVLLHTRYRDGDRLLRVTRSRGGEEWSEPRVLARAGEGHYQISTARDGVVSTAFNLHPEGRGLNWRTNLYYLESRDGGRTWRTVAGDEVDLPVTDPGHPSLAVEYASRNRLVYLKSMARTADGRPVILYLTSDGYASGPRNDPRRYHVAAWTGSGWRTHVLTVADNNYDYASLYLEEDGRWRVIGATEPGPQRYNTGGEIAVWVSEDRGRSWRRERRLTSDSKWNHAYPRRPEPAHPEVYALWADGHGRQPSDSRLYLTDRSGDRVRRLPVKVDSPFVTPRPIGTAEP